MAHEEIDMDGIGNDRCMRAAQAAIEVVRDECAGMDVEVREVSDGMLLEMPTEAAEMMDDAAESPVPLDNFTDVIDQSSFVREFLGGRAATPSEDTTRVADADNRDFAVAVHQLAGTIFDDGVAFAPDDLLGSEALEMIADAA